MRLTSIGVMSVSMLLVLAVAAGAQPPEAARASLAQRIVQEVRSEVPPAHLPVYRDFAVESISALTGVGELNGPAEGTVVHSIVQAVLMHNRSAGKMSADDLRKRLRQFLEQHRGNLAGVTPEMLLADWPKRRRDVAKDVETVRGMVEALFKGRPVVVLDPLANCAARLGRDSLGGLTITSQYLTDAWKKPIPEEEVSENARKIVLSEVRRGFDHMGEGADHVDSIYLMAEMRYRGPLTAEGAKALNQYLEKTLLHDGVCVISDRVMPGFFLVLRKYLFFGAEIPAVPEEGARNETVRNAFQVLWDSTGRVFGFPPAAFGGAVPEDILSGKRFGFHPRMSGGMSVEGQRLSAQQAAEQKARRDFENLVPHWFSRINSKVDRRGYVECLADDLLWSFYDEWKGRAFLLKDFFGDKTEAELKFSPLEQRVLDTLRRDRKSSVLFSDQGVSKDERIKAFDRFFGGAPTAEHAAYQTIAQDLGVWLKQRYSASVTQEMERGQRLRERAEALLEFLGNDVREVNGEDTKPMVSLLFLARKKLRQAEAFSVDKPLPQEVLKDLTPLERALYHYFDRAKAQNPVLGDIESSFTYQTLFERYRNYLRAGRPKEEQQAYEDAVRALAEQMGKQLKVPKAEQLISFPNSPEAKPRGRG